MRDENGIKSHRTFTGGRQASVLLGASCTDASNPGMYAGIAHGVASGGGEDYCAAVIVHELAPSFAASPGCGTPSSTTAPCSSR
jgi:hypothetical protein